MKASSPCPLVNRELSWLHFNARVLQEAENPAVPLYERLNYLAIFSSNLDEFFSVRVAALRSLLRLGREAEGLKEDPARVLTDIHRFVHGLQERFGSVLRESLLPALAAIGVPLVRGEELSPDALEALRVLFERDLLPHLRPLVVTDAPPPLLAHQQVYLACSLAGAGDAAAIGLVELPTDRTGRFVTLETQGETRVLFLEDVVRLFLETLFPDYRPRAAHSFKVSRDADLFLGDCAEDALRDEFNRRFRKQLRKSLDQRGTGTPTRFLYDPEMPPALLRALQQRFGLADEDLMPGGRYHHLRDLRAYPRPPEAPPGLDFAPHPPQPHPVLARAASLFDAVQKQDHLLVLPYQQFDVVPRWVNEAAADPAVERIAVTIYRTAPQSALTDALAAAAAAGKRVEAVVELKARFDEANNLDVSDELERAGVEVHVTPCELKVHAKLILIERREGASGDLRRYAYLSTGNLNEQTATLYTDYGLFTADPRLTDEVALVFEEMKSEGAEPAYTTLLVAPRGLRTGLYRLIEAETERARRGEPAWLFFKMNALEDSRMIRRLCAAAAAGATVRLLVRGICRLSPADVAGGEKIEVRSIVGRYLEHGRAYVFGNGGAPLVYLGSADLMRRNLNSRIEVLFPMLDPALSQEVLATLELQWADTLKARLVDGSGSNLFVQPEAGVPPLSSQDLLYARYGGPLPDTPLPAAVPLPAPVVAEEESDETSELPPWQFYRPTPLGRFMEWVETHPVRSSVMLAALLLCVPLAAALIHTARTTMLENRRAEAATDTLRASYAAHRPDTVLLLPDVLTEISGQALLGDTLLAAVQDERGTLFFLDPATGQIVHTHDFAGKGDYEEVALTPEGLYVLNSAGQLFHVPDWSGERSEAVVLETPLTRKCDAEGLAYDAAAHRLLIACKEDPGKKRDAGAIFAFDLATRTLAETPAFQLDLEAVAAALRHAQENPATATLARALSLDDFKPSALGIHPLNGQIYVVSSRLPAIAVLTPEGALIGAELLPGDIFPQPEGIAFFSNGDLLLSSEGGSQGTGRLARFRYLKR